MTKPMSALRQRMIDDMKIRNMSPNTQYIYTRAVANFSSFHQQSPDKLTIEDVRDYRLHLIAGGLKAASINPIMGALRFFYGTTLGQKQFAEQITFARQEDRLPAVPTRNEVVPLLKAVGDFQDADSLPPACASPRSSPSPRATSIVRAWWRPLPRHATVYCRMLGEHMRDVASCR